MAIDLAGAANVWAAEHPAVVETMSRLEDRGVNAGVSASSLHQIVSIALDVPVERAPDDVDLLIPSEHFEEAAGLLGATAIERLVTFQTGDNYTAHMWAREIVARVGPDDVQLMDPLTPLHVGPHQYNTTFTEQAAAARMVHNTRYGVVPLVHPVDALGIYAIGQRPGRKNDQAKSAVLLVTDPFSDAYSIGRTVAMGWDRRTWDFVWRAGPRALELSGNITLLQKHVPVRASI